MPKSQFFATTDVEWQETDIFKCYIAEQNIYITLFIYTFILKINYNEISHEYIIYNNILILN